MATKKKAATPPEVTEELKQAPADPWAKTVEIKLPKGAQGEPNYITAGVNGRVFKIQKGVAVKVPAPIAEVIRHSFEARDAADQYLESLVGE